MASRISFGFLVSITLCHQNYSSGYNSSTKLEYVTSIASCRLDWLICVLKEASDLHFYPPVSETELACCRIRQSVEPFEVIGSSLSAQLCFYIFHTCQCEDFFHFYFYQNLIKMKLHCFPPFPSFPTAPHALLTLKWIASFSDYLTQTVDLKNLFMLFLFAQITS